MYGDVDAQVAGGVPVCPGGGVRAIRAGETGAVVRFRVHRRPAGARDRAGGDERPHRGDRRRGRRPADRSTSAAPAAASGSRSTAGLTFKPVFDEHTESIGAVTIDPANPKTVWVGTGEAWTRNSVSVGDGVYKTTDGGETWKHLGLEKPSASPASRSTRAVATPSWSAPPASCGAATTSAASSRPPTAARPGRRCSTSTRRPAAPTSTIDPQEPTIALRRHVAVPPASPDFFSSGGPGSGLYKSTDGGETWKRVTQRPARRASSDASPIAVAPSRPERRLRPGGGEEDRALSLRRRRRELAAGRRRPHRVHRPGAAVLLRPPAWSIRPTTTRVYKPGPDADGVERRRHAPSSSLTNSRGRAPRPPRAVDQSGGPAAARARHRRRRLHVSRPGATWRCAGTLPVSQFYHVSLRHGAALQRLRRPPGQRLLVRPVARRPAASATATGRTSASATASRPSPTPATRRSCTRSTRAASCAACTWRPAR